MAHGATVLRDQLHDPDRHDALASPSAGTARSGARRQPDGTLPILFIIGSLEIGGAEKQLVEIALGLDRSRFSPMVCSLAGGGPLAVVLARGGVPVVDLGLRGASSSGLAAALASVPGALWRLVKLVRQTRPAVVHGMLFHAYVLAAFTGKTLGVPAVIASRRSLANFKRNRLSYRILERAANRLTDCIVANSEAVKADTVESEGLSPADVLVIHNGIDVDRYRVARDAGRRSELGLGRGPVVVVLANFIHYKGHDHFLEAWTSVIQRFPGAVALLVGDGPLRAKYESQVSSGPLAGTVFFLGIRKDVPELLAQADVLVHPSREEGFSNAILEAMAAGLPVIATRVGGNPEAVVDGVTGNLVPPREPIALRDAMQKILGSADLGKSMGDAGRARVIEHFQLAAMIRQYEALYERAVGVPTPTRTDVRDSRAS